MLVFRLIFTHLQFLLIFLTLIFVVFVQILKPGLKINKQQKAEKFSQLQRKIRNSSEIRNFRYIWNFR